MKGMQNDMDGVMDFKMNWNQISNKIYNNSLFSLVESGVMLEQDGSSNPKNNKFKQLMSVIDENSNSVVIKIKLKK